MKQSPFLEAIGEMKTFKDKPTRKAAMGELSIHTQDGLTFTAKVDWQNLMTQLLPCFKKVLTENGIAFPSLDEGESTDVPFEALSVPAIPLSASSTFFQEELRNLLLRFSENLADEFAYQLLHELTAAALWGFLPDSDRGKLVESIAKKAKANSSKRIKDWALNRRDCQGIRGRPRPNIVEEFVFRAKLYEAIQVELRERRGKKPRMIAVARTIYRETYPKKDASRDSTAVNSLKAQMSRLGIDWQESVKSAERDLEKHEINSGELTS